MAVMAHAFSSLIQWRAMPARAAVLFLVLLPGAACGQDQPRLMTSADIVRGPFPPADYRVSYGADPLQFGDLRLPKSAGQHPVAVLIHGGCWLAQYNLDHLSRAADALARAGVATWMIEYRRVGNPGGGWPGTFEDVANGAGYLRELAKKYPLDLDRVVVAGHSAGGHLALWLATQRDRLKLRGVVSLAGVHDLRAAAGSVCDDAIPRLLGGEPAAMAGRYRAASPIERLPLRVPVRLVAGRLDRIVPLNQAESFEAAARKAGDDVRLMVLENAGHFEMIWPGTRAWETVERLVREILR
jgi:acetyl esterase/lipase